MYTIQRCCNFLWGLLYHWHPRRCHPGWGKLWWINMGNLYGWFHLWVFLWHSCSLCLKQPWAFGISIYFLNICAMYFSKFILELPIYALAVTKITHAGHTGRRYSSSLLCCQDVGGKVELIVLFYLSCFFLFYLRISLLLTYVCKFSVYLYKISPLSRSNAAIRPCYNIHIWNSS